MSYIAVEGLACDHHVLMTDSVEPIYGMVTKMMTKHRTQLLSTTKGDLRPRLANLKFKFAKLKCFFSANDDFISSTCARSHPRALPKRGKLSLSPPPPTN